MLNHDRGHRTACGLAKQLGKLASTRTYALGWQQLLLLRTFNVTSGEERLVERGFNDWLDSLWLRRYAQRRRHSHHTAQRLQYLTSLCVLAACQYDGLRQRLKDQTHFKRDRYLQRVFHAGNTHKPVLQAGAHVSILVCLIVLHHGGVHHGQRTHHGGAGIELLLLFERLCVRQLAGKRFPQHVQALNLGVQERHHHVELVQRAGGTALAKVHGFERSECCLHVRQTLLAEVVVERHTG